MLWKAQMQCLIEIVMSQQSHMRHMPSRSLGIVHPQLCLGMNNPCDGHSLVMSHVMPHYVTNVETL